MSVRHTESGWRRNRRRSDCLLIASLCAVALVSILEGWQVSVMWSWFAVPLGFPPIGMAHAVGICTLIDAIRGDKPSEMKTAKDLGERLWITLITMAWGWVVGIAAHILM